MKINTNEYNHTDMFNVNNYLELSHVIHGCDVVANTPADTTVVINSGYIKNNGQFAYVTTQTVTVSPANLYHYRYAAIVVNSSGVASVILGGTSSNDDITAPLTIPDYDPDTYVLLARIKRYDIITQGNSIRTADIKDMRVIYDTLGTSLKLINQTINGGVVAGNSVYPDSGTWKIANAVRAVGIYEGSNVVTLKGVCALSGLQPFRFYFKQTNGTIGVTQTDNKIGYSLSTTRLLVDIDTEGSS